MFMGATCQRQARRLILWIGLKRFIANRAGIRRDGQAHSFDARVGAEILEGGNRSGKFPQIGATVSTIQGIIR